MAEELFALSRLLMGTEFRLLLAGQDVGRLRSAAEEALDAVERIELEISPFLHGSGVSRLNRAAGTGAVVVDGRLLRLLRRAVEIRDLTGGAFDVTATSAAGARVSSLRIDEAACTATITDPAGAVDPGGIGKGFALDEAAALLRRRGVTRALLSAGESTVLALGTWPVGLADPERPGERLARFRLRDAALSASAPLGRAGADRAPDRKPIVDPRSGRPAPWPGAFALSPDAATSDALATAFAVLGPADMRRAVGGLPGTGGAVLAGGRLHRSGALRTLERARDPARDGVRRAAVGRRTFLATAASAAAAFAAGLLPAARANAGGGDDVRLAVVGTGEHGRVLLRELGGMKGVRIAAVCDTDRAAAAKGAEIAGRGVEIYGDWKELLEEEPDLDGVVVATPTHRHAPVVMAALAAGRHVYVEAPVARTAAEARDIARAASAAKRIVATGHHRRVSELYRHALKHARSGAIGEILRIRSQWHRKESWRRIADGGRSEEDVNWRLLRKSSGGLLLERGVHAVDLACWYLDALPDAVTGLGTAGLWKDGRDVDDNVEALISFPGGRQVAISCSLTSSHGGDFDLIMGTAGSILILRERKGLLFKEADAVAQGWEAYARSEVLGEARGLVLDVNATKYKVHLEGETLHDGASPDFRSTLAAFVLAIREGTNPPGDIRAGARAVVVAAAAEEALRIGTVPRFAPQDFEI